MYVDVFASIGLSADFGRLKAGGKPLIIFYLWYQDLFLLQDAVGVGLASALGLDPLLGLVAGSVSLTGVTVQQVLGVILLRINMVLLVQPP